MDERNDFSPNAGEKGEESGQGKILLFPDFEELKREVEKRRTELSMLLLERDELRYVVCRNLETEYMLELGGLEYKIYQAQCTALRLKRKTEYIQARKNRQEKVNLTEIEEKLDLEFAEYRKRLDEQMQKMNNALHRKELKLLSEEDTRELKKLYRRIVKALHPDMNPEVTPEQIELFEHAVQAYKDGDLATLRLIAEMADSQPLPQDHRDALTRLKEDKSRLKEMLRGVRESIEKIKSQYPYTLKEILGDRQKLEERRKQWEEVLRQYREQIEIYQQKIEEMLR